MSLKEVLDELEVIGATKGKKRNLLRVDGWRGCMRKDSQGATPGPKVR
jgi:hypothetical protein